MNPVIPFLIFLTFSSLVTTLVVFHFLLPFKHSTLSVAEALEDTRKILHKERKRIKALKQKMGKPKEESLKMILGEKENGEPLKLDLHELPHLFAGGATNSGKTNFMYNVINSLLEKNENIKFYIFDPKGIDFIDYAELKSHYVAVDTEPEAFLEQLKNLVLEMDRRNMLIANTREMVKGIKAIKMYNKHIATPLPYIVVLVDELGDLLAGDARKIFEYLARKGRTAGIHLVLATQHLNKLELGGGLVANLTGRVALQTIDGRESEKILGEGHKEAYLLQRHKGEALFVHGVEKIRFNTKLITPKEVASLIRRLNRKYEL